MRILLINPPVYDFTCFDYWLKPLGLLYLAAYLKENNIDFDFFDFMDRKSPYTSIHHNDKKYSVGNFIKQKIQKPESISNFDKTYFRYGVPESDFADFLKGKEYDFIMVTSMMSYWYPGIAEVIKNSRKEVPHAKIVLGGVYARLLKEHSNSIGADYVYDGDIKGFFDFFNETLNLKVEKNLSYTDLLPLYELYKDNTSSAILTQTGCPFRCSYCSVHKLQPEFLRFPADYVIRQLDYLESLKITDVTFYDDAILYKKEEHFIPLFKKIAEKNYNLRFHFSNGLHVRFIDESVVSILKKIKIGRIMLSVETVSEEMLKNTGGKSDFAHIDKAIDLLFESGFQADDIFAYILIGLKDQSIDEILKSIEYLKKKRVKIFINEYSPIAGTEMYDSFKEMIKDPVMTSKSIFSSLFVYDESSIQNIKNIVKAHNRGFKWRV